MTIIATDAGPGTWAKIANVHEARGEWLDAADAWHKASLMTQAWNPAMAKQHAANAERCLTQAVAR